MAQQERFGELSVSREKDIDDITEMITRNMYLEIMFLLYRLKFSSEQEKDLDFEISKTELILQEMNIETERIKKAHNESKL